MHLCIDIKLLLKAIGFVSLTYCGWYLFDFYIWLLRRIQWQFFETLNWWMNEWMIGKWDNSHSNNKENNFTRFVSLLIQCTTFLFWYCQYYLWSLLMHTNTNAWHINIAGICQKTATIGWNGYFQAKWIIFNCVHTHISCTPNCWSFSPHWSKCFSIVYTFGTRGEIWCHHTVSP